MSGESAYGLAGEVEDYEVGAVHAADVQATVGIADGALSHGVGDAADQSAKVSDYVLFDVMLEAAK